MKRYLNQGKERLYYLKTDGYRDDYVIIQPSRVSNIPVGAEQNLSLIIGVHLPRENPQPINEHTITLPLITAGGQEYNLTIPIVINYADIIATQAKLSEDQKTLVITLDNNGTLPFQHAKAELLKPFKRGAVDIGEISENNTTEISFTSSTLLDIDENSTVELRIYLPNLEEEQRHTAKTKVAPLHTWHFPHIQIIVHEIAWYIYALWVITFLALLGAIYYYRRYKNPMVIQLATDPEKLLNFTAKELTEAQHKLSLIKRWETLLETTKVTPQHFEETLAFYTKPNAEIIARRIGAETITPQDAFYKITLPESIGLTIDNFLLYLTDQPLEALQELQNRSDKILIITRESYQDEVAKWANDKTNRIIAPTQSQLTELLLRSDARELFVKIMAQCLSFKHLSPYQTNLGVRSEEGFFGRTDIVRDIITSERKNYLIVGARQLGKTAILQALERRYRNTSQVECYSFNLEHDSILDAMNSALGLPEESSLETIVKTISQKDKKCIFLIDEADLLLEAEKQNGYRVTGAFRKLAQEDKATFVLAGFWVLYQYVVLDYQSALKNFGELIILEVLEPEACRDLMVKPMQRIGVTYENDAIIEAVITRCGRRANLIATICSNVLEKIDGNTIRQSDIDQVLLPSARKALKSWEQLTPDEELNRINRILVYLTLHPEHFRLEDIVTLVEARNLPISIKQIQKSLEQLTLGYILKEHQEVYRYSIPLFVEMFQHTNIELSLKGEVVEL